MSAEQVPRVIAVGGTDCSGGAGLSADLLTLAAHGVHGLPVVTAVTAQDARGVHAVHVVSADTVAAQLRSACSLGPVAVKIGMLADAATVCAVAGALPDLPLVLDPVIRSSSGTPLLDDDGLAALVALLLPRTHVLTPNLPEARALGGTDAASLLATGPQWVVLTGGHCDGDPIEHIAGRDGTRERLTGTRVDTPYDRGTGCTFASSLAAGIARGSGVVPAARAAQEYVQAALATGYSLAEGFGVPRRW